MNQNKIVYGVTGRYLKRGDGRANHDVQHVATAVFRNLHEPEPGFDRDGVIASPAVNYRGATQAGDVVLSIAASNRIVPRDNYLVVARACVNEVGATVINYLVIAAEPVDYIVRLRAAREVIARVGTYNCSPRWQRFGLQALGEHALQVEAGTIVKVQRGDGGSRHGGEYVRVGEQVGNVPFVRKQVGIRRRVWWCGVKTGEETMDKQLVLLAVDVNMERVVSAPEIQVVQCQTIAKYQRILASRCIADGARRCIVVDRIGVDLGVGPVVVDGCPIFRAAVVNCHALMNWRRNSVVITPQVYVFVADSSIYRCHVLLVQGNDTAVNVGFYNIVAVAREDRGRLRFGNDMIAAETAEQGVGGVAASKAWQRRWVGL